MHIAQIAQLTVKARSPSPHSHVASNELSRAQELDAPGASHNMVHTTGMRNEANEHDTATLKEDHRAALDLIARYSDCCCATSNKKGFGGLRQKEALQCSAEEIEGLQHKQQEVTEPCCAVGKI